MDTTSQGIDGTRRRDVRYPDVDDRHDTGAAGAEESRAAKDAAASDALARWIAGAAPPAEPGKGNACDGPDPDYDACVTKWNAGDAASPLPSTLYLREKNDVDAISPHDVQQRGMGDCYFLAAVAGLAATDRGRELIRHAITETTDAQGKTAYAVTLFVRQTDLDRGPDALTSRSFPVSGDGPYVTGHAAARDDGAHYETWPLIMEKAYAQMRGGYDAMGHGGSPKAALEALTGRPAESVDLDQADSRTMDQVKGVLAEGRVAILSTRPGISAEVTTGPHGETTMFNRYGLVAGHAYLVKGVGEQDGQPVLLLHNPWGYADPKPVPVREAAAWFRGLDVSAPLDDR